ncbi:hypothetical protein [Nocardia fusca]|uniref:Uncharacterized protein n=1 Tax=Nocardia fusca TaxID=941183 RepID=A0ABV3FIN7_9NOCA
MSARGPYEDSYRSFLGYAKKHEMTVLHDNGLYRHIRFHTPGNSCGWFQLVTWPGYLSITGDFESYTFCRVEDMFDFFADSGAGWRINPDYWEEKLVASSVVRAHSPEKFRQQVVDYFWEARHRFPGEAADLFREIREDVLAYEEYGETARGALDSFRYRGKDGSRLFEFSDWYEWDLTDWSIHYLRACHAIVWGINRYRSAVKS